MLEAAMIAAALAGTPPGGAPAPPTTEAAATVEAGAPFYFPLFGGVMFSIAVDRSLVTNVNEHEVEVIAIHDRVVTLIDAYRSRPHDSGACADGRERYVRVLDIDARVERFARLIDSCTHGIVVDEPPVSWAPDNGGFTINYRSEPALWVPVAPGTPRGG